MSVCRYLWGGGGGYPSQVQLGRIPQPGPAGGYPLRVPPIRPGWRVPLLGGVPHLRYPHQTWAGGYPCQGVPHLRYHPLSDLAGGYPCRGGISPRVPPHQTWLGVPLLGEYPTSGTSAPSPPPPQVTDGVLDTPRSVCLLRSRRRTFLLVTNFKIYPSPSITLKEIQHFSLVLKRKLLMACQWCCYPNEIYH